MHTLLSQSFQHACGMRCLLTVATAYHRPWTLLQVGVREPYVDVVVVRRNGADGTVSVEYESKEASALSGTHFEHTTGRLEFGPGQTAASVRVPLNQQAGEL